MNLTALTEPQDVAVKHFVDSLMAYDTYFPGKVLADVGTGAGFPGIPLKIFCPSLKVVLIDSLAKRLNFLQNVIEALNVCTCVRKMQEKMPLTAKNMIL